MKPSLSLAAVALCLAALPVHAQTRKPCEELKSEIAQKLDAKGVSSYTLEIVAKDQETDAKVVGTCDGGTKKIVYKRADAPAVAPAKEANKP